MTAKLALRTAIVFEWLFGLAMIVLSFALERFLPEALREYVALDAESPIAIGELLLLPLAILLLIATLASSIGLLLLQRWARWSYLASVVLGCVITPFLGPTVEHSLTDTFDRIATTLSGLVIGIAFFSDAIPERKSIVAP